MSAVNFDRQVAIDYLMSLLEKDKSLVFDRVDLGRLNDADLREEFSMMKEIFG